jgi:antitoxin component YwqK of YwqJK toxin-antitoxin module
MNLKIISSWLLFIFLLAGCEVASVQYPAGSIPYPPPQTGVASGAQSSSPRSVLQPQPPIGSQRRQYALEKALEGMAIGGAIGGIYGAGGGLVLGFLTGLFTAEIYDDQLNSQIQSEQTKDKLLEAKIEQELERQRQLETQLLNSPASPQQDHAGLPPSALSPLESTASKVAMNDGSSTLASLSRRESPSNPTSSPFKNVEVRDINGDGVPDLWIYYSPLRSSEIVRQEEASQFDGRVDSWSHFKDGRLVRREVDSKGKGLADTVYYYENEKIVREERDDNANGHVSFRAIYQNGRRAKVEEDTSGRGKIDQWIYFDSSRDGEIVLKEERDLNGDGVVDLWAYYEDGRLVRRDVNAVGAELLSKQDRLPFPAADSKNISQSQPAKENRGPGEIP